MENLMMRTGDIGLFANLLQRRYRKDSFNSYLMKDPL